MRITKAELQVKIAELQAEVDEHKGRRYEAESLLRKARAKVEDFENLKAEVTRAVTKGRAAADVVERMHYPGGEDANACYQCGHIKKPKPEWSDEMRALDFVRCVLLELAGRVKR